MDLPWILDGNFAITLRQNVKNCALAALAVVSAASAQSSVTISGLLDFSAVSNGKITTDTGTTKSDSTGAVSNFSTAQISFAGTEDLGGGLKAGFVLNSGVASGAVGDRDKFLTLAGGAGTLKIGRYTPAAAYGFNTVNPTTFVGSIYSIGQVKKVDAARLATTTLNFERNDNNVQYTSPAFNGLTLNVNYGTSSSDDSLLAGETKSSRTGLSVSYANGPLSLGVGVNSADGDVQVVDAVASSDTKLQVLAVVKSETTADLNWISASYDLGVAKLIAAHVTREDKKTTAAGVVSTLADIEVTNLGVSVPMGAITLSATVYSGKNKVSALTTDDTKLSGNQITARYALSKRTFAYAMTGTNKIARDGGNTTGATFKENGSAIGLVHSF